MEEICLLHRCFLTVICNLQCMTGNYLCEWLDGGAIQISLVGCSYLRIRDHVICNIEHVVETEEGCEEGLEIMQTNVHTELLGIRAKVHDLAE